MKFSKSTQLNIRIIVGFYLLYIDYSILSDWSGVKAGEKPFIAIFTALFAVFAVVLITLSTKELLKMKKENNSGSTEGDGNQEAGGSSEDESNKEADSSSDGESNKEADSSSEDGSNQEAGSNSEDDIN